MNTDLIEHFHSLCSRLGVDPATKEEAQNTLIQFINLKSPQGEQENNIWPVCALAYFFLTKKCGNPLSQLLDAGGFRLYDFLEPFSTFVVSLGLDERCVNELKVKFLVVSVLYEKYEILFFHLFQRLPSSEDKKCQIEKIYRLGWYLFLLAKGKLLKNQGDLVQALFLLLSCINLLVMHMPECYRKIPLADIIFKSRRISQENNTKSSENDDILVYLCHINNTEYKQAKYVQERLFNAFLTSLNENRILNYQAAKIPPQPLLPNCFYLGGILDSFLSENEKNLNNEYEILIYENSDFNERLFITGHPQIMSPLRNKYPPAHSTAVDNNQQSKENWLSTIESVNTSMENIITTLKSVTTNLEEDISVINKISKDLSEWTQLELPKEVKDFVMKLHYQTLDRILTSELQNSPLEEIISLISNEIFDKSLLGCCIESVISCSAVSAKTQFPWVLNVLKISAVDFCVIAETFVKNQPEPKLPREILKHLVRVEESILEKLGWEETSPVFTIPQEDRMKQLIQSTLHSFSNSFHLTKYPTHQFAEYLKEIFSTSKPLYKKIVLFLRKVLYITNLKVNELCLELLHTKYLLKKVIKQVEFVIIFILVEKTHLLLNRHLDQIIMCTIFGVCIANKVNVSFRQITDAYSKNPQTQPKVFLRVLITPTEIDDIVKFYNTVFLPDIESILTSTAYHFKMPNEITTKGTHDQDYTFNISPNFRVHRSPQKIQNLMVSPRHTPLLYRSPLLKKPVILGTSLSPQKEFSIINEALNGTPARKKLEFSEKLATDKPLGSPSSSMSPFVSASNTDSSDDISEQNTDENTKNTS